MWDQVWTLTKHSDLMNCSLRFGSADLEELNIGSEESKYTSANLSEV